MIHKPIRSRGTVTMNRIVDVEVITTHGDDRCYNEPTVRHEHLGGKSDLTKLHVVPKTRYKFDHVASECYANYTTGKRLLVSCGSYNIIEQDLVFNIYGLELEHLVDLDITIRGENLTRSKHSRVADTYHRYIKIRPVLE